MTRILNVYGLPDFASEADLKGGAAVAIDVLRATTTIVFALEAGAREVIPCVEVEEARRVARKFPRDEVVLGGERGGLPIDGFDLGNSPDAYTTGMVSGKTLVFSTSNGTRAIDRCRSARRTLIGAFVNASAVYRELLEEERVHLVCAGTNGQISRDDVLLAGLLVERISRQGGLIYQLNAQALTARENWLSSFSMPAALGGEPLEPERLAEQLRASPGGQNLVAVGLEDDILVASQIDRFGIVPEVIPGERRIVLG